MLDVVTVDVTHEALSTDVRAVPVVLSEPMSGRSVCYVVKHRDASRVGEVISAQVKGYQWAPFENGQIEQNGVLLAVADVPDDSPLDPRLIGCGAVGYVDGQFVVRENRCGPDPVMEDQP